VACRGRRLASLIIPAQQITAKREDEAEMLLAA